MQTLKTEKRKLVDENLKLQRTVLDLERKNGELRLKQEKADKRFEVGAFLQAPDNTSDIHPLGKSQNMEKNQAFLYQQNEELSKQLSEAQKSRNDDKVK